MEPKAKRVKRCLFAAQRSEEIADEEEVLDDAWAIIDVNNNDFVNKEEVFDNTRAVEVAVADVVKSHCDVRDAADDVEVVGSQPITCLANANNELVQVFTF